LATELLLYAAADEPAHGRPLGRDEHDGDWDDGDGCRECEFRLKTAMIRISVW
jgi:hypothetical protein